MKNLHLLTWVTQLGLSVAVPPIGMIWLASWLRRQWQWGSWVIWVAAVLGVYCAVYGLYTSLKALKQFTGRTDEKQPPTAFNDHI